ncbi:MAG: tagatose 1,6-diphosphate aldolase [Chloroflexota bacterium]
MTKQISPGRYRGLKTTSLATQNIFGIVAFDQRGSYRRMMPDGSSYEHLVQVKNEIIGALALNATAILTDPTYGLYATMQMSGKSGLLMSLEKSGYSGDSSYRTTELQEGWTPKKIRKMGASAVKFMVYYNPQNEELADELDQLVIDVVHDCHQWDLPVFLEPMSYSANPEISKDSADYAAERSEIVIETARRLSKTGADVLKMEFPVDIKYNQNQAEWRKYCEQLSEASAVPWVLLSAGVDFEQFVPQVIVACESGASGFLAGRAIWKEAATMSTEDRTEFLSTTATDRLKKLLDIAGEKSRPWSEFYSAMNSSSDWFKTYSEG